MTAGDLTENPVLVFAVVYAQAFAILGGIMAIQRKNWKLAVVCGVASLLNFGFFLIGTFLGLAGLIAIITARRDFIRSCAPNPGDDAHDQTRPSHRRLPLRHGQ